LFDAGRHVLVASAAVGLGRRFGWLWAAYAVSTYGTALGFGAFAFVAITVLGASAAQVSLLSACGLAVGAVLAVPLAPWVEFRRKRPVMIVTDLVRCAAMASVPVAYWLGVLGFGQLVVVAVVVATAKIAFTAASGAFLPTVVAPARLLAAHSRFESTQWSATVVGPMVGGAAMGLLGPVTTIVADAAGYLLSAVGVAAIGGTEERPPRPDRLRAGDLVEGWRYLWRHPTLRPLFLDVLAVNGLIMACEPLLTFLMLGPLGFPTWQYGLAFALPCLGGIVGSRLAPRIVARWGRQRVLRVFGVARVCWPVGLVAVGPGLPGLLTVMVVEFGLILCIGVFNPAMATERLQATDPGSRARMLAAWSTTSSATIALLTTLWGLLAGLTGPRLAIGAAGVLLLATPWLTSAGRPAATPEPA